MKSNKDIIVFGGGCFWCTEAVFQNLKGVLSVQSGYAGGVGLKGEKPPSYDQISTGKTGYAEVIKIEYDTSKIKFNDLLTVFFGTHDSTTMNRQGADVGTQYRSTILFTTEDQDNEARAFIQQINASSPSGSPVVTIVEKLGEFYPAEEYHQNYYKNNSSAPYCQIIINPKLEKVQKEFSELLEK